MIARLGDRSLFPLLEARAYWNHAGISTPSDPVRAAAAKIAEDYARRGAGAFLTWMEQRGRLREKMAKLIDARADEIAIMPNTTRGVIDTAMCFPWKKGDRVVVFEGEFPANVTPWQRAADAFGVEVVMLDGRDFAREGGADLAPLEAALKRGVRLVAVSAVQFQTGLRVPLADVAKLVHAHGAELFVDAVQACGATPVEVRAMDIDYLAAGSHKWMMGFEGAGFLFVKGDCAERLRPNVAGWLSHEDGLGFLFEGPNRLRYDRPIKKTAALFEGGNVNAMGCAALEASLDLILSLGVESIWRHVQALHDALEPELVARGFSSMRTKDIGRRSCTLSVLPPAGRDVIQIANGLGARGVSCATPDGYLRFAPHWPNGAGEVAIIVGALDEVLRG